MPTVSFTIPMIPAGQGRPRTASRGKFVTVYKATADRANEGNIAFFAAQYRPESPITGPVTLSFVAVMPRTAELSRVSKKTGLPLADVGRLPHAKVPDLDNLAKAANDALKSWWIDDRQVCDLHGKKVIAAFGEQPHWEVTVSW